MATAATVREELRAELVATRAAFLDLLGGLSDADWRRPTRNTAWTVGDLLHHLVWSLEQVPREVASARRGKGMFNLPRFLRDPLSAVYTRQGARRQSLATVARRYDAAYDAALRALDEVRDDEWQRGAPFWGEGFITIEGLFRAQAHHLVEHRQDIAAAPQQDSAATTSARRSPRSSA
jgi:uncharacterized protein (TIGR03083 family)